MFNISNSKDINIFKKTSFAQKGICPAGRLLKLICTLYCFSLCVVSAKAQEEHIVPSDVVIGGQQLGGKTVDEAVKLLDSWRLAHVRAKVYLYLPAENGTQRSWTCRLDELGMDIDTRKMVEEAVNSADELDISPSPVDINNNSQNNTITLPIIWIRDMERLRAFVINKIVPVTKIAAVNARLDNGYRSFHLVPSRTGRQLDIERTISELAELQPNPEGQTTNFALPVVIIQPLIPTDRFADFKHLLGQYSTRYRERNNRQKNIVLACSKINMKILQPGEEFSYNGTVGPRSSITGFSLAPIILGEKHVLDYGGGICQVSSTLYNAVMNARLKVTRRQGHSKRVYYLPEGKDATVSYGAIDFRFVNTTSSKIAILARGVAGRVVIRIVGAANNKVSRN